jgi:insulysin
MSSPQIEVLSAKIEKPEIDDRSYRLIRLLDNKLEALLVRDPKTDKASAAMDVHVGHLSDPKDFQGLAHALEHCLFLGIFQLSIQSNIVTGTKKYPEENDYHKYLAEHSGSANAFTGNNHLTRLIIGMDNTNYYFQVGHEFLEPTLDRFSQFFIAPLFLADCTDRELRAVDSEHKKNLQSDTWRLFQLDKNLSNPDYPYNSFGTGNLVSLKEEPSAKGLNVRDAFMKFHETYYSSNLMKLVVLGREPLDQLEQWVVDKFAGIKNKSLAPPNFKGSPYTEKELQVAPF